MIFCFSETQEHNSSELRQSWCFGKLKQQNSNELKIDLWENWKLKRKAVEGEVSEIIAKALV